MFKNNIDLKEFIKATLIRAIWTMAQTGLAMVTIGMGIADIDWVKFASVVAVSGFYSILKSIVVGVPEAYRDGTLQVDISDPNKDVYRMVFDSDLEELKGKNTVTFTVDNSAVVENKEE